MRRAKLAFILPASGPQQGESFLSKRARRSLRGDIGGLGLVPGRHFLPKGSQGHGDFWKGQVQCPPAWRAQWAKVLPVIHSSEGKACRGVAGAPSSLAQGSFQSRDLGSRRWAVCWGQGVQMDRLQHHKPSRGMELLLQSPSLWLQNP